MLLFLIISLVLVFGSNLESKFYHNGYSSIHIEKVLEKRFVRYDPIRGISVIEKIGNRYFLLDQMGQQVYYLDDKLEVEGVFDADKCHPGSPFRPHRMSKLGTDYIVIGSNPVLSYRLNGKTLECTTRYGLENRFLPIDMAPMGDGMVNYIQRPNFSELSFVNEKFEKKAEIIFEETFPFKRIRFRNKMSKAIFTMNNQVYFVNGPDYALYTVPLKDIEAGTMKAKRIELPVTGRNGIVKPTRDVSANDELNPKATYDALNGYFLTGVFPVKSGYIAIHVQGMMHGKPTFLFGCELKNDIVSSCELINDTIKDGRHFLGASDGELFFQRYDPDDEYFILEKYVMK